MLRISERCTVHTVLRLTLITVGGLADAGFGYVVVGVVFPELCCVNA